MDIELGLSNFIILDISVSSFDSFHRYGGLLRLSSSSSLAFYLGAVSTNAQHDRGVVITDLVSAQDVIYVVSMKYYGYL